MGEQKTNLQILKPKSDAEWSEMWKELAREPQKTHEEPKIIKLDPRVEYTTTYLSSELDVRLVDVFSVQSAFTRTSGIAVIQRDRARIAGLETWPQNLNKLILRAAVEKAIEEVEQTSKVGHHHWLGEPEDLYDTLAFNDIDARILVRFPKEIDRESSIDTKRWAVTLWAVHSSPQVPEVIEDIITRTFTILKKTEDFEYKINEEKEVRCELVPADYFIDPDEGYNFPKN